MNDEYVALTTAAKITGTHRVTLQRRIRAGEIATFEDPLDRRKTLIRKTDLEAMRHPRPAQPRNDAAMSAA